MSYGPRCPVCSLRHPRCRDSRDNRWPLAPLLEAAGGTRDSLRERCGASGSDIAVAARNGVTDRQADTWATRLGCHPGEIWGDWFTAGLTVLDDLFVNGNGWRRSA